MVTFFNKVITETRRSLSETFTIFDLQPDWVSIIADLSSKLLVSLVILLVFIVIYFIIQRILLKNLERIKFIKSIKRPVSISLRYTFAVLGALALMAQYGVPATISLSVARAAVSIFLFYVAYLIISRLLKRSLRRTKIDPSLIQLLSNILVVLMVAFASSNVLSQFGIDVLSLVAALGVVGIAVGFAAQETIANLFAGITLLVERPFKIGEWVSINGQVGKVRAISLRTTRLATRNNELTIMPNASVTSSDIINFSAGGPLRVNLALGIAYKENIEKARSLILEIIQKHDAVLKRPAPSVRLSELADSSLNLDINFWIKPEDIGSSPAIQASTLEAVKVALDDANIDIPFPHRYIIFDKDNNMPDIP